MARNVLRPAVDRYLAAEVGHTSHYHRLPPTWPASSRPPAPNSADDDVPDPSRNLLELAHQRVLHPALGGTLERNNYLPSFIGE